MSDQREGGIAWTDQTWNPVRGCSRVDPDCVNCYAEGVAGRFSGPGLPYEGLAVRKLKVLQDGTERLESRWTREVRLIDEHLSDPIRWKRPRRIFVNSMSDLFHEKLSNQQIAAVFGVMAAAPHHTFQVLTKRARRMRDWLAWVAAYDEGDAWTNCHFEALQVEAAMNGDLSGTIHSHGGGLDDRPWPLPNVWLGTSVGHQGAVHRIDDLRACPAAVRFVSFEPLHGPVSADLAGIHWGIIGGESGPRARPFDLAWGRSVEVQLRAAGAAVFWKQLGSVPIETSRPCGAPACATFCPHAIGAVPVRDKKGGDQAEWPPDIRSREFPAPRTP